MRHIGILYVVLVVMAVAVVLSGCASSPGDSNSGKVVAVVGTPTPYPTPPEPTPRFTWVPPSPTPKPLPLTISEQPDITGVINPDQPYLTDDPNFTYQASISDVRQDTIKFSIQNTGDSTLNNLKIDYMLYTPTVTIDSNGNKYTSYRGRGQSIPSYVIGTLNPREGSDITIKSPVYGAMMEVNFTISATWDGGSMVLYEIDMQPNFNPGKPPNLVEVKSYGSKNN